MKVWVALLILAALSSSCALSSKKRGKKKSDIFFQYGSQQLVMGKYTTALENLLRANKGDPDNPEIINNLALAYFYKKRPATAKELLINLLKNNPNHSDALNNLGTIYMREDNYDEAERHFMKVTKDLLFKKQFVTYHNLSKIFTQRGNIKLSRHYNDKSLEEFNKYCPALFHRGFLLYREKKWEKADMAFKKAMKGTCYNYVENHFYRAMSLKHLQKLRLAEEALEKVKIHFTKNPYLNRIEIELRELRKIKNARATTPKSSHSLKVPKF